MGSLNNILLELEELDEIPELLYLEEKLHEVIVAVEVLDSKLDMLTYISITPAITKSLLKYLERKAMYAEEPSRTMYYNNLITSVILSFGRFKMNEQEAKKRIAIQEDKIKNETNEWTKFVLWRKDYLS